MLGRNVVMQLLVEHDRRCMQVCVEPLVLGRQIIVLLFIHFLVDDILLSDAQSATSALLVDFRSSSRRLNACLQTTVTAARGSNISTAASQLQQQ